LENLTGRENFEDIIADRTHINLDLKQVRGRGLKSFGPEKGPDSEFCKDGNVTLGFAERRESFVLD
jgi:hypothetical protein